MLLKISQIFCQWRIFQAHASSLFCTMYIQFRAFFHRGIKVIPPPLKQEKAFVLLLSVTKVEEKAADETGLKKNP